MAVKTVGIMSPGDMGHAVGRALGENGYDVVTCLAGRSEHSRELARAGNMRDAGSLEALVGGADLVLAIMPPSATLGFAREAAAAMRASGATPPYADCNAVSPGTARQIADVIQAAGAIYIDAGIIGGAPGREAPGRVAPPRFYASGPDISALLELDGKDIDVRPVGDEVGRASAMKMCYAALTKGTNALYTAVATAAESLGIADELRAEFESSQPDAYGKMRAAVPRMAIDAGRWVGEMEEIAATFSAAGVTGKLHEGAAELFRMLDTTPFAAETRQTIDRSRTLEDAVAVYVRHLPGRAAAD
ncbi:MAG: DUF1932 domain-containing protein [Dehalococcoidia bacterium]